MQALLGQEPAIEAGDALPPFFHQIYFWDPQVPEQLGRDGHPKTGGFIPDMGLPRRMWAGGRLEIGRPLLAGTPARRLTFVDRTSHKDGRSGPLGFVTLRHEFWQSGDLCVTEWQDLVYRQDPGTAARPEPPSARDDEDFREIASFSTTALFRYSALTFNGHRIHYDIAYAKEVEGYEGLVVHGPLLAQHLMLLAERRLGRRLASFSFRATSALMHFETAEMCWSADGSLWVRGPDGRQCMTAMSG